MSSGNAAKARFDAIRELNSRTVKKFDPPRDQNGRRQRISEFFGMNTFDINSMKDKLPKDAYSKLLETVVAGQKLDVDVARHVAAAVKDWAMERGVTHFCHWFQPQTGGTAEKHDAFLAFDENNLPIEKFSASQLIQSEPDASSFPSGGMRATFEARGYTAWDPTSPIFIMDSAGTKTLCIPSAFISYHGAALDEKTPLIRSMEVLSQKACELLSLLGVKGVKRVVPTLGIEQEYFLIDRAFFSLRPDLVMTGRTLLGSQPPKGQQLEDHYFGSIPARVMAFMAEVEHELYKLGVPIKTRHNEVAPSQYETAPIFEEANIATDHNQVVMEVIKKVAMRHNFRALLHEKPFAGVNGSGKHNNWSMMIAASGKDLDGDNLLDPGKTPQENMRFLMVLMAVLKGVHKHSGLLRAGIASAGNDHRLGANEAPPAIISVFLGDLLNRILNDIESGTIKGESAEKTVLALGVSKLPEIMRDNTDRNRTSPFAFTGNKFEFRAVGSSASCSFPITMVNAAVADGFTELTAALKGKLDAGKKLDAAVLEVIREVILETKAIRFEGNNYSEEWVKEAESRGLPNLKKTPEALAQMVTPKSTRLLTGLEILTEAELHSRYHVHVEQYIKKLTIELNTLQSIVDTLVLPVAFSYHGHLAAATASAVSAGVAAPQSEALKELTGVITALQRKRKALGETAVKLGSISSEEDQAKFLAYEASPAMEDVRALCDQLESLVSDEYWPLPKYREILFLS